MAFLISGELSVGGGWGGEVVVVCVWGVGWGWGGHSLSGSVLYLQIIHSKNQKLLLLGLISILGGQESFGQTKNISSILPVSSPLHGGKMR